MTTQRICGKCGAPVGPLAPDNLCLNCLLESAVAPEMEGEMIATSSDLVPRAPRLPDSAPTRFGDYELLEEIARGGMGVVYRARQISLDRIVAVKMLPFGALASQEIVQRFRIEAAAAASLQHPHIVAIYEVGFHDGQHFFAMEYVAGRSLTAIVKDGPLLPKRAAAYLKTIAEAIHYAHERNILHRDLKPSNILIDQFDQPKVTDFGLAKRLETELELTLSGQLLGSPNYMSPEQAAARRGAVGRRSDVYALGAILYHLLTGRPPFVAPTVAETLQEVLNTEPVSPRVLNPGVPRDLDTICLKCLEKDSARRYETAEALARDIERHLNDEPVAARPPSRLYRFQKLARRNRLAFAAVGAVAAALFIGSGISTWEYFKERRARERAVAAELEQKRQAAKALAVSDVLQQLLGSADPNGLKGSDYTLRQLLDDFSPGLTNQLAVQPEVEATVRYAMGWTYLRLGEFAKAEPNLRFAFTQRRSILGPLHPQTLEAEHLLAFFLVGATRQWDEGGKLAYEAWQGRKQVLGPENPDTVNSQESYATALREGGHPRDAETIERQILEFRERDLGSNDFRTICTLGNLGQALELQGAYAEAEPYVREAVQGFRRIGYADQKDGLIFLKELAMLRLLQGDAAEAETLLVEGLPRARHWLGPNHQITLQLQRALVRAFAEERRFAEAESLGKETLEARRRNQANLDSLGTGYTLLYLGRVLVEEDKLDEAEPYLQEGLTRFRQDAAKPELAAQASDWLGVIRIGRKAYPEAEALILPGSDRLFARHSEMSPNERRIAVGHLVKLYEAWGKPDRAAAWQNKLDQLPK